MYRNEHLLTGVDCGWVLSDFAVNSGSINGSQSAYLETSVVLLSAGQLIFDYRVDAEPKYDGLTVYVDRQVVMPKQSTVYDYSVKTIDLTEGYHFVQFVYSKDQSINQGADAASINLVQFSPVVYAADSCEPCRAGRFQNQTGKSYCFDCPENTYSSEGSFRCTKCSPGYYSFEGSASCTKEQPCTENDVHYLYNRCYSSHNSLVQDSYPVWNTPHICDDSGSTLPPYPTYTNPCIPCNPGEHRLGTECVYCPPGYASASGDSCTICPPGTQAIEALYIDHFDFWDQGLHTNCSYFCGSDGWELHDDYVDSGSGHGRYVNSDLYLDTTLTMNGYISFHYVLNCTQPCSLQFDFTNGSQGNYRGGPGINANGTPRFSVLAGENHFRWVFTKNDPDDSGRFDNARIDYILVTNVNDGGAVNCTNCSAGYYASSYGSSVCSPCPPGTYSSPGSTACTVCEDGFFSPDPAASSCLPCGESTQSNDDHTDCIVTCQYQYDDRQYDLSPMARSDGDMYGPIYDAKDQIYYLNLCVREHNNHTCLDLHNNPIDTFACQVTLLGYGVDLGDTFGFLPLRNSNLYEDGGLTVHLTHGESCKNSSGQPFPRQTYIDVICDPSAGVGSPTPLNTVNNTVESSKCVYEFAWRSLYGCHICTEDDYYYIISQCDNEGKQTIEYQWSDNPKSCHGGISLPDPIVVPCADSLSIPCPPGYYLDLSTLNPVCTETDAGFYSIGGGKLFDDWSSLPSGFSSVSWFSTNDGKSIRSADGNSFLLFLDEFKQAGDVTIDYRIFGFSGTSSLAVYVDNLLAVGPIYSTGGVPATLQFSISEAGSHFIRFEFVGGEVDNTEGGVGVEFTRVLILGLTYAAEYQTACPAGTFSPLSASSSCIPCPENTYSPPASSFCTACPTGFYSPASSSSCSPKSPCTLSDYQLTYTDCSLGVRYKTYLPLEPFVCDPSHFSPPSLTTVPCDTFPCSPGEYRKDSQKCDVCAIGYYFDSTSNSCAQSAAGYAGLLQTGYYCEPEPALPVNMSTVCYGDCVNEGYGWRSRSTFLDSGSNDLRHVDVALDLFLSLPFAGSISFEYEVTGDRTSGLLFFINDKQQQITFHSLSSSASFSLPAGDSAVRWVYHQENGSTGSVSLHDIFITGVGGAVQQIACPPGTFSSSAGSNDCAACPAGTFSSSSASTSCSPCSDHSFSEFPSSSSCQTCGDLTFSNDEHTDCFTDCLFAVHTANGDEGLVDLQPLASLPGPYPLNSSSTENIWLNVCAKETSPLLCISPVTGDPISTYSCLVDSTGRGIDSGRLLSISIDDKAQTFSLRYSDGQLTDDCPDGISTELLLTCDPDLDSSSPFELPSSSLCHLKLQWNIAYACPLCTDNDYTTRESDCKDGLKTIARVRSQNCYGPLIADSSDQQCSNSLSVSWVILIAVCIVLVILVIVFAVIVYWNRQIIQKYTALVQKSDGSYEMTDMPESLLDVDENELGGGDNADNVEN